MGNMKGIEDDAAVQLRGLPYKATIADIRAFLGSHEKGLAGGEPIQLIQKHDGRASGFANVQFASPAEALAAREGLHMKSMDLKTPSVDPSRYIEILPMSERAMKLRFKKATAYEALTNSEEHKTITEDDVLKECRWHLKTPGSDTLLLSMLGVALSPAAHAYLKRSEQGVKCFLTKFPKEFTVAGAKGSENVKYLNPQSSSPVSTPYSYIPTPSPWNSPNPFPQAHAVSVVSQHTNIIPGGMHGCVEIGSQTLGLPSFETNWTGMQSMLLQQPTAHLWGSDDVGYSESLTRMVPSAGAWTNMDMNSTIACGPTFSTPLPVAVSQPAAAEVKGVDRSKLCLATLLEMM